MEFQDVSNSDSAKRDSQVSSAAPVKMDLWQAFVREIKIYLSVKSSRTQKKLASRAEITERHLSRIMQGQTKDMLPETVLAVLRVIMNKDVGRIMRFINEYAPEMIEQVKKVHDAGNITISMQPDLEEALSDAMGFKIISFAASDHGTTETFIKEHLGLEGVKKFRKLVEAEILEIDEDGIAKKSETVNFAITKVRTMVNQAHHCLDSFAEDLFLTRWAGLGVFTEYTNEKGLALLKSATLAFGAAVVKMWTDPELKGNIPYYAVVATSPLISLDSSNLGDHE